MTPEPAQSQAAWSCRYCGETRDREPSGSDLRPNTCKANRFQSARLHLWVSRPVVGGDGA